eukprot:358619-Chlamydomonas_euryale.AAC.21
MLSPPRAGCSLAPSARPLYFAANESAARPIGCGLRRAEAAPNATAPGRRASPRCSAVIPPVASIAMACRGWTRIGFWGRRGEERGQEAAAGAVGERRGERQRLGGWGRSGREGGTGRSVVGMVGGRTGIG